MTRTLPSEPPANDPKVIELDRSRTARAFGSEQALWYDELERIFRLVRQQLEAVAKSTQKQRSESATRPEDRPPHLSIGIFGSYGSGKSSLLQTVVQTARRDGAQLRDEEKRVAEGIHALPIIRPNLLAAEESFLYAFLAAASESEQEVSKESDGGGTDTSFMRPFQQAFQRVSEFLRVIDQTSQGQDYDALGVSLERLERHTSDLRLRHAMEDLIAKLAKSLTGNDDGLILLPVDDADMSQTSLSKSLDTCMRYLHHPQLVPVFTFTGRLSEELMSAYFARRLSGAEEGSPVAVRGSSEFEEKIALQYLARMFPIRNRIRLGASTVQVQKALYCQASGEERHEVFRLLVRASRLLFGMAEARSEPQVRLVLRPPELRKQLQILDVLDHAGVQDSLLDQSELPATWCEIFENVTWSFLDVHRDILRQSGLHLDELYGYPSRGLRELVLGTLLAHPREERRMTLERWRHQTEDQRAQVISLLALNAFRPAVREREVVPGQLPADLISDLEHYGEPPALSGGGTGLAFSQRADMVFVWFMTLWSGCYLPLILTRERRPERTVGQLERPSAPRSENDTGTSRAEVAGSSAPQQRRPSAASGVGWHVPSASNLACREALLNIERQQTGMFFLDEQDAKRFIGGQDATGGHHDQYALLFNLWCSWGHEGGQAWVMVSLWRGLGLISQLLELNTLLSLGGSVASKRGGKDAIKDVLRKHLRNGRYFGSLALQRTAGIPGFRFGGDQGGDLAGASEDAHVDKLADAIREWLDTLGTVRASNFVRRLHGDHLLGDLWPKLDAVYDDTPESKLSFWIGLHAWHGALMKYWEGTGVDSLLEDCPVFRLFSGKSEDRLIEPWFPHVGVAEQPPPAGDAGADGGDPE